MTNDPDTPRRQLAARTEDSPPDTINVMFLIIAKVPLGASRTYMQHRLEVALSDLGEQIVAVVPVT